MAKYAVILDLPTARKDGTALAPSDLASLTLFRVDGDSAPVQVATLAPASASSGQIEFDDDLQPGPHAYFAEVTDKQANPLTSDPSDRIPVVVPAPLAAPNAPTVVSITLKAA